MLSHEILNIKKHHLDVVVNWRMIYEKIHPVFLYMCVVVGLYMGHLLLVCPSREASLLCGFSSFFFSWEKVYWGSFPPSNGGSKDRWCVLCIWVEHMYLGISRASRFGINQVDPSIYKGWLKYIEQTDPESVLLDPSKMACFSRPYISINYWTILLQRMWIERRTQVKPTHIFPVIKHKR